MNVQRTLKCPKCRTKCMQVPQDPSTICIADYNGENKFVKLSEDEFKVRIWAYMKPPRISEPVPSVNPERLEMVRNMLDGSAHEKPTKVNLESSVNLDILPDGSLQKTTSRLERKIYAPTGGALVSGESGKKPTKSLDLTFEIRDDMSSTRYH